MRSLLDSIPKFHPQTKDDLPISQSTKSNAHLIGLRRRIISSFSVKIQPLSASCSWAALRRSSSSPAFIEEFARGPLRRWWDWSFGWLLSKKPGFARDLEMNDEEAAMLGCHSKGTIRHLFHKIRSEIRKIRPSETLPMTAGGKFSYDSFNYAKNFDEGLVRG